MTAWLQALVAASFGALILTLVWRFDRSKYADMRVWPRSAVSDAHSPNTAPLSTPRGVGIATIPARAPRFGGLAFFATTSSHGGV